MKTLGISLWILASLAQSLTVSVLKMSTSFTPGNHHVIIFKVTNSSDKAIKANFELQLPQGWSQVTKPFVNSIPGNKTVRLIYTVALHAKVKNGKSSISLIGKSQNTEIINTQVEVMVEELHDLSISLVERPTFVLSEKEFSCVYRVTNKGNVNEPLLISSRIGYVADNAKIILPIDSSILVTVFQKTQKIAYQPQTVVNDLIVFLEKLDTQHIKNTLLLGYPATSASSNLYRGNYLIESSLGHNTFNLNDTKVEVFQFNVSGKGFLDLEKKKKLDFTLRGTDKPTSTRFETYNRYSVTYSDNYNELTVGDFNLNISRLMNNLRIGRGVDYHFNKGRVKVNAFYNTLLFYSAVKNQYGASIGYESKDNVFSLKLNSLYRNYQADSANSFTTSLEANYIKKNLTLKSEYALSRKNNGWGMGYYFLGDYRKNKWAVSTNVMLTTENLEGFYSDGLLATSFVNYKIHKKILLSVAANYNYITPKFDQINVQAAPFSQNYFASATFVQSSILSHKLGIGKRSNIDRGANQKFDYSENLVQHNVLLKTRAINWQVTSSYSKTENKLIQDNNRFGNSFQSILNGRVRVKKNLRMGLTVDYSNTNRYSERNEEYLFYGGNISYSFKRKFNFSLSYRNNYPLEEQYKINSLFSTNLSYTINSNHSLMVSGRTSNPLENETVDDYFFSVRYNVKVNVPTFKNRNLGHLKGKITAGIHTNCEGIVLLMNGMTAITNKKGEFEFHNLPATHYQFVVEVTSLPDGLILAEDLPQTIVIFPKRTVEISLSLIKPASISGGIQFETNKQIQSKEFKTQFSNVIIKLTKDSVSVYTLVDRKRNFIFSQLKPGIYQVSIVTKDLEKAYDFPIKEIEVELKEGEEAKVELSMKERSRRMNFSSKKIKLSTN